MAHRPTYDQAIFAALRPLMSEIGKASGEAVESHRLKTKFKHVRDGKGN